MNNHHTQKKWTPKETAIAMKMFDNNKTHKEIAEFLGRTSCSVAQKLNKVGCKESLVVIKSRWGCLIQRKVSILAKNPNKKLALKQKPDCTT